MENEKEKPKFLVIPSSASLSCLLLWFCHGNCKIVKLKKTKMEQRTKFMGLGGGGEGGEVVLFSFSFSSPSSQNVQI